jgi:dienelactone hydrolase
LLFISTENDFWIAQEKMEHLRQALVKYDKSGEVKIYGVVGPAFFKDARSDAYDANATQDAWVRVKQFFANYLK